MMNNFQFSDRTDAGRRLAARLLEAKPKEPIVYALPRGGVPVALEIALALRAPLDLILVRKIGAPGAPEVALGAVVEGDPDEVVINEKVQLETGATDAYIERVKQHELSEIQRRRSLYLDGRTQIRPAGHTAIIVDDGLATGATAKAAIIAMRSQGASRVILAIPVGPEEALAEMRQFADSVICLHTVAKFSAVGEFYEDFHQLTDEETTGYLRQGWKLADESQIGTVARRVAIPPCNLLGDLYVPANPKGIVVFAHGSGSSRLSPRNISVARRLNREGFATLLLDLLTTDEAADRHNVFDISLLAGRLLDASVWIIGEPDIADLPMGFFGASTGAAAALLAASKIPERVRAIVSRGGRPDLAGSALATVASPTLLIVGSKDEQVLKLNNDALSSIRCDKEIRIVPGATHLFEEPGALEKAIGMAAEWFQHYLTTSSSDAPRLQLSHTVSTISKIRAAVERLPSVDDEEFACAFDKFADARLVLLGEASHGTSEFYQSRAAITRRLIEKHNFTIVAVEADWPDAAAINRSVQNRPARSSTWAPFTRFPTWMWRNKDFEAFVSFLRNNNAGKPVSEQVGFFGLDLYNMTASIGEVVSYLDRVDKDAAIRARNRYACISSWSREPSAYGRASLSQGYALCEKPVIRILVDLLEKELEYCKMDGSDFFEAKQNARLVASAERYYRAMYYGAHESWNLRDQHMFNTLQNIMAQSGPTSKAVVWAHNSHIGDARFTAMGKERSELNLGQLCRQAYGKGAVLIGFGTHTGTVAAASDWDAPMERKQILPSLSDSYESLLHDVGSERFLLDLRAGRHDEVRQALSKPRLERYIGVIYQPETERWSHYSHASLANQYDAFVWFDETHAITPLSTTSVGGEDEMFPFGL